MENFKVKDLSLAEKGKGRIAWAEMQMKPLMLIREEFEKEKPLANMQISMALHVTKETAVLVRTLKAAGAKIAITSCNPLSTQDDVAAALAKEGINVFAWRNESEEEYWNNFNRILDFKPQLVIDDGADLISLIHTKRTELIGKIIGGAEETTTGIMRIKNMERENVLKFPVIDVNDADTKRLFDNHLGTAQSTFDALMRSCNILLCGKKVVIIGYGFCGSGLAKRAKGLGAEVIIVEVDPIKALSALMEGYRVMTMSEAAKIGDIFITVTGNKNVIDEKHFKLMKDGAILLNVGHFDVEINVKKLREIAKEIKQINYCVEEFKLENKKLYLLAKGRLANLACAEGHPSEVMALSFCNQALAMKFLVENKEKLENKLYAMPKELDKNVAELMLKAKNVEIEILSEEQKEYLEGWK